eukprot:206460-Rhodomonas_salina.1
MPCCSSANQDSPEYKKHRVHFMIGRGGGGHIAAARALQDSLIARNVSWAADIEFVDTGYLFDQIIAGRSEPRKSGFDGDELYNWLMKNGQYTLASLLSPLGAIIIRAYHGRLFRGLEQFWREREPRAVICFVPVSGVLLRSALLRACPRTPLFTVVTDMSSTNAHKWLDPYDPNESVNHTIVAGSQFLQEQTEALGYPSANVLATSGMLVHPRFYEGETPPAEAGPEVAGSDLALPRGGEEEEQSNSGGSPIWASGAKKTRGVVFFGGQAPMRVEQIALRALEAFPELHLVVMCGGNAKLLERMHAHAHPRCTVEGFLKPEQVCHPCCSPPAPSSHLVAQRRVLTSRVVLQACSAMPCIVLENVQLLLLCFLLTSCVFVRFQIRDHFLAAEFIIGKPGPGVVAEAVVCGLPYVAELKRPMSQEASVLDYLRVSGTAPSDLYSCSRTPLRSPVLTLAVGPVAAYQCSRRFSFLSSSPVLIRSCAGVGVLLPSLDELPLDLLRRCDAARATVDAAKQNRAVFELCDFLEASLPSVAEPAPTLPCADFIVNATGVPTSGNNAPLREQQNSLERSAARTGKGLGSDQVLSSESRLFHNLH